MKQAKKRRFNPLDQTPTTFVEALMSMPNVGMDADFERIDAVDKLLQFMRDAPPTVIAVDLKQLKEEGRS